MKKAVFAVFFLFSALSFGAAPTMLGQAVGQTPGSKASAGQALLDPPQIVGKVLSPILEPTVCPTSTVTTGIDVSDHQSNTNWSAVKTSGRAFAFIKATQGTTTLNPNFKTDWDLAKTDGLLRSAYHFFMPADDPTEQSRAFLEVANAMEAGDLPPMFDWEITDNKDAKTIIANAKVWLGLIEKATGKTPIIYTSPGYWRQIGSPVGFEKYPLFVADYQGACPEVPAPWKTWLFWQHGIGTVPGVTGPVDLDVLNGPLGQ